jgi:hypothetical protein
MTLEQVSLIAQILSVLLVPASLVFVGMQMRQTHAIERANAQRHVLSQWQEWMNSLARDGEAFADVRDCLHDYSGQSEFKRHRFFAWAFESLWIAEQTLYQWKEGLINEKPFLGSINAVLAIIVTPGGQQWWVDAQKLVGGDIRDFLVKRLAGGEAELPPQWQELATHFRLPQSGSA